MSVDPLAASTGAPYYFAADKPVNGGDASGLGDSSGPPYGVFPILQNGGGVGYNFLDNFDVGKISVSAQWTALTGLHADASLRGTDSQATGTLDYHDSSRWDATVRLQGSGESGHYNVFTHFNQSIWDVRAEGELITPIGNASASLHATPSAIEAFIRAGASTDGASCNIFTHLNQHGLESIGAEARIVTPDINIHLSTSYDLIHGHGSLDAGLTGNHGSQTIGVTGQYLFGGNSPPAYFVNFLLKY
jgi:hypothetical protein